jgi:hypothetical protein
LTLLWWRPFLPLADNEGLAFPAVAYEAEKQKRVKRFGGLTPFTRAPAEGL